MSKGVFKIHLLFTFYENILLFVFSHICSVFKVKDRSSWLLYTYKGMYDPCAPVSKSKIVKELVGDLAVIEPNLLTSSL